MNVNEKSQTWLQEYYRHIDAMETDETVIDALRRGGLAVAAPERDRQEKECEERGASHRIALSAGPPRCRP